MIEIINLNVSLGGTHILKDINLSIKEENSIIGIFGPNGAGKTTLISVLTGSINNYTGAVKGICAKDRKTWIKIESENFPVFQRYA